MIGIDISVADWLLFSLIGVIVGLDSISWPQAMWSRPLVAGTVGGLLFGDPAAGCLVGIWLELVMSRHPPFGAARYPEAGPAALTAGAAFALSPGSLGALLGAVLVGWMIGWVGMHSVAAVRAANEGLVANPAVFEGKTAEVARRHRLAIRLDAGRAAVLSAALLVPSALFVRLMASLGQAGGRGASLAPVLAVAGLAGLTGVGARALGSRRAGWPALVVGGVVGLVLAWVAS